jgi:hypothetical protein
MNWILIVFAYAVVGQPAVALTSVSFETEAACHAAGDRAAKEFARRVDVKFICARKN